MRLLDAVNTVLPHLGEHPITAIETTKHPTVDLIIAAIERQTRSLLTEGYWFNELILTLPVNTDGRINTPENALDIYGIDCNVSIEGEQLFDLNTGSYYFTRPIKVKIIRDIPFEHLPEQAALCVTYNAGAEQYVTDFGVENSVGALQSLAEWNRQLLRQEELRKRRYNNLRYVKSRMKGFNKWR